MGARNPDAFPETRHSIVRAIADGDAPARAAALDALIRGYWRPVYAYIRLRWRRDAEDARDLTQEFFTRALEKEYLSRYDPGKARFRTFLRTCLDGFLANASQHANRLKRGGDTVLLPLDFAAAERDIEGALRSAEPDPETCFRQQWARAVLATAVNDLRLRADASGRALAFALFSRYDLEGADDDRRPTYAALAAELGTSTTNVTNQLAWARREFRALVMDALRALCASEEEFRAEVAALLATPLA